MLFVLANLARKLGLDPEECLRRANAKFARRFEGVEQRLAAAGQIRRGCDARRDGGGVAGGEARRARYALNSASRNASQLARSGAQISPPVNTRRAIGLAVELRGIAAGLPVQQPARRVVPGHQPVEQQEMAVPAGEQPVFMRGAAVIPAGRQRRQVAADPVRAARRGRKRQEAQPVISPTGAGLATRSRCFAVRRRIPPRRPRRAARARCRRPPGRGSPPRSPRRAGSTARHDPEQRQPGGVVGGAVDRVEHEGELRLGHRVRAGAGSAARRLLADQRGAREAAGEPPRRSGARPRHPPR